MIDQAKAMTAAIENSTKVANSHFFSTVIDKMLGFKISEWDAQGQIIKKQILDNYEDAKLKGLGFQYVSAFRSNTNLINIGRRTISYIDSKSHSNIGIDNDVFWGLLEHSKEISNEDMQELIAKIIAGEYNTPGTYSMSTLQTLKMLGKKELELFERIGSLIINADQIPQALFSLPENAIKFMKEIDIDFGNLQALQNLGLFLPNDMVETRPNPERKKFDLDYFGEHILFNPSNQTIVKVKFPNYYGLSDIGKQIFVHLKPKKNDAYLQWLKENYRISGYDIIK